MSGITNRGKYKFIQWALTSVTNSPPGSMRIALCTSAVTPSFTHNVFASLTEIALGNGYSHGGTVITCDTTDWDVVTEDDANRRGYAQVKDIVWTASGGNLPASGDGARYAVLLPFTAGTIIGRDIVAWWDLTSDRTISDGQTLTLQDCEIRYNEY